MNESFGRVIDEFIEEKEYEDEQKKLKELIQSLRVGKADSVARRRGNPSRWRKSLRSLWLRADSVATLWPAREGMKLLFSYMNFFKGCLPETED